MATKAIKRITARVEGLVPARMAAVGFDKGSWDEEANIRTPRSIKSLLAGDGMLRLA